MARSIKCSVLILIGFLCCVLIAFQNLRVGLGRVGVVSVDLINLDNFTSFQAPNSDNDDEDDNNDGDEVDQQNEPVQHNGPVQDSEPVRHNEPIQRFEPPQHDAMHVPQAGLDFIPNFKFEQLYSAKACWLDPTWATAAGTNETCVGRDPNITHTTAKQLTCPELHPLPSQRRRDPSSNKITIALLYYASPAALLHHLKDIESYPDDIKEQITLLIVDDGSPDQLTAKEYVTKQYSFKIRIARITTDKAWNIGGARNLAFYLTETRRVLLNDIDMMIPAQTMQKAVTWQTWNGTHSVAHRFLRLKPNGSFTKHPAVTVLDASSYWRSGGCDEDFVGHYGFTDVHYWYRWSKDPSRAMLDHDKSASIVEFDMDACDPALMETRQVTSCQQAKSKLIKPNKGIRPNKKKLKAKTKDGCWSNRFLRFPWLVEKDGQ